MWLTWALPDLNRKRQISAGSSHWDLQWLLRMRTRTWGPLRSRARGWGWAAPTEIWSSHLRSGSVHWDLPLAVEVRQCPEMWSSRLKSGTTHYTLEFARKCPLRSGVRSWGPAVPTEICSSQLKSGNACCDLEFAVGVRQCPLRSGVRCWGRKEGGKKLRREGSNSERS